MASTGTSTAKAKTFKFNRFEFVLPNVELNTIPTIKPDAFVKQLLKAQVDLDRPAGFYEKAFASSAFKTLLDEAVILEALPVTISAKDIMSNVSIFNFSVLSLSILTQFCAFSGRTMRIGSTLTYIWLSFFLTLRPVSSPGQYKNPQTYTEIHNRSWALPPRQQDACVVPRSDQCERPRRIIPETSQDSWVFRSHEHNGGNP